MTKRIEGAAEFGVHKTSMLQDLVRGRPMEIDALLGAVVELGQLTGHAMPATPCRPRHAGLRPGPRPHPPARPRRGLLLKEHEASKHTHAQASRQRRAERFARR
jgi:hypothetical protein